MNLPKKFKRHKTIAKLMACLLEVPEKEAGEIGMEYNGGKLSPIIFAQSITKMGIWGFVDNKNIVHYWMKDDATFEMVLTFLAHETGHLNGRQYKDEGLEEEKAHLFDQVALYAFKKAQELIA